MRAPFFRANSVHTHHTRLQALDGFHHLFQDLIPMPQIPEAVDLQQDNADVLSDMVDVVRHRLPQNPAPTLLGLFQISVQVILSEVSVIVKNPMLDSPKSGQSGSWVVGLSVEGLAGVSPR